MLARHTMQDSERMRIVMYLSFGGWHYRTVAARVYGGGRASYKPSPSEVARVGKIAREENLSSRDWRNGITTVAKRTLSRLGHMQVSKEPPKLKLAV